MSLKDVLTTPSKYKPVSWYEETVSKLSAEDREWLDACIANTKEFSGTYLANKMSEAGFPVSATTINHIRKTLPRG